ncbi:unnamed protein product [Ambrosiozyma monospora]|uniref:Unnamed protein product n=1 Tax=Ambrosiozyma monospora TaxID=43982 RepID=A0ACB5U7D7_AMBMO|nr:unnamed protein product [Ambrosiozyma monospora]
MLIHTDAKPFNCASCQKGFNTRQQFTRHMKTHEKKRKSMKQPHCDLKCDNTKSTDLLVGSSCVKQDIIPDDGSIVLKAGHFNESNAGIIYQANGISNVPDNEILNEEQIMNDQISFVPGPNAIHSTLSKHDEFQKLVSGETKSQQVPTEDPNNALSVYSNYLNPYAISDIPRSTNFGTSVNSSSFLQTDTSLENTIIDPYQSSSDSIKSK